MEYYRRPSLGAASERYQRNTDFPQNVEERVSSREANSGRAATLFGDLKYHNSRRIKEDSFGEQEVSVRFGDNTQEIHERRRKGWNKPQEPVLELGVA